MRARCFTSPTVWIVAAVLTGAATASTGQATELNGFDLHDSPIPADEIHPGGPSRDGIPSIDNCRPSLLSGLPGMPFIRTVRCTRHRAETGGAHPSLTSGRRSDPTAAASEATPSSRITATTPSQSASSPTRPPISIATPSTLLDTAT